jgi:two-component system, LytTR family, response regulator
MIKAIIIDDEQKSRNALLKKLKDHFPEVEIIAEAENGYQGIELIELHKPNLIFLDIEMPKMNGFEMLASLTHRDFEIIFTTAYDHYAIQAIRCSAFDYILKPVSIEDLTNAIDKINLKYSTDNRLDVLLKNLSVEKKQKKRIAIASMNDLLFFNIEDVLHLEAFSNYTIIDFVNHAKITTSKTLKDYEDMLPSDMFCRVHHSHIINISHVKKYIKGEGGQVILSNGTVIDVSRRKKDEFLQAIKS